MGIPLLCGSPPRRGEQTVLGRAPPHLPLLELRTRKQFSPPPGTSYLPRQSDIAYLDFVVAPLPKALPGGEPCIYYYLVIIVIVTIAPITTNAACCLSYC